MPANKKYLTKSPFQRFLKITAGFVGGYAVTMSFHLLLTRFFHTGDVIITTALSGVLLWAVLLLMAFLSKSVWKIWLAYIVLTLLFSIPFFIN